jgi:hypothetical protein
VLPIVRAVAFKVQESVIIVFKATSLMILRPVNLVLQTAVPVIRLVRMDVIPAWKDSGQISAIARLLMVLTLMVLAVLVLQIVKSVRVAMDIAMRASQVMCPIRRVWVILDVYYRQ